MHTRGSDGDSHQGVGAAAREVVDHGVSVLRLELRLALAEIKARVAVLGVGVAFAVGAALCFILALLFAIATVTAAIARALPVWLALLIMTFALGLFASALGVVAVRALRRASPVPKQAIEEAKRLAHVLKGDGRVRAS
jgi:hypothetical protein